MIETDRLSLHELSADDDSDVAFIYRLLNEPSFLENIGDRGVHCLDDAQGYLRIGPMASYLAHGFGLYRVQLKASGERSGLCGLVKRATLPDPDLGYALLPEFCGQGYAVEAARAVLAEARTKLGIDRILAITDPRNTGSIRLLEKLDFRFEKMVQLAPQAIELKLFASTAAG